MNDFADLFRTKNHALVLPKDAEDEIDRYIAMHSKGSVESRPFPRKVDFWAFGMATALALNLEPRGGSPTRWGKTFIYTSQGIMDNDLCALLAVVAIAKFGHRDPKVSETREIVGLANRLAAAGCPKVLSKLSGTTANAVLRTTPLDRALELARSLQDRVRLND